MLTSTSISISQHLPWVNSTLDYTERLIELVPDELLDLRPTDPLSGHFFTPAEVAMHLADERRELARMLHGSESREQFWTLTSWETGGDGTPWTFRPFGSRDELLDSLREGRAEFAPWLSRPLADLHTATDGTRRKHEELLAMFKGKGMDTTDFELRGPSTINRVLFALTVHESGHRGYLQTILRLNGVDARGDY
jgi:hypothetical protein